MGIASWCGEPSGSIIKLDLLSLKILAQVEIMASRLCGISSSPTISHCALLWPSPASHVPAGQCPRPHSQSHQGVSAAAQHQNRAMTCPRPDLWDEIQRKLNEVRPKPITAADLSVAFLRIWTAIPMAFINRLIHSMYRRCLSVVNAHGGHEVLTRNVPTDVCDAVMYFWAL